jgi:P-type Cu+ transporter
MEHKHHLPISSAAATSALAKDPVCGMSVDPATARHKAEYAGAPFFFCSGGCREKFVTEPTKYLAAAAQAPPKSAPWGAIYTCPMHPQIRQDRPGACPICGMALEPEIAAGATGPSTELIDMTRRFWIALALSIPVFALEMGGHLADLHAVLPEALFNWIELALATPVALWAGWPFFERGLASLKSRNLNMFTLIAMGVGVAWTYSVVATVAPGLFPSAFRGAHGAVAVYFEAAAVITTLVLLGQYLSSGRASRPAAPSARCSILRQKPPGSSVTTAPTRRWPSTWSKSATPYACGRARRSPWMEKSSRGEAPSTNPC